MDETPREPAIAWKLLRRHFVRIVIGAVLVAVVSTFVFIWMPYQREQRIARKIEAVGGYVAFGYVGPTWVPIAIQYRLPFWNRIDEVMLENLSVPPELFSDLETLTNPYWLHLNNADFTDEALKPLNRLNPHYSW